MEFPEYDELLVDISGGKELEPEVLEDDEVVQPEATMLVLDFFTVVEPAVGEAEVIPVLVVLIELE